MPWTRLSMAVGWSPAGGYGWYSWNGLPGYSTKPGQRLERWRPHPAAALAGARAGLPGGLVRQASRIQAYIQAVSQARAQAFVQTFSLLFDRFPAPSLALGHARLFPR